MWNKLINSGKFLNVKNQLVRQENKLIELLLLIINIIIIIVIIIIIPFWSHVELRCDLPASCH